MVALVDSLAGVGDVGPHLTRSGTGGSVRIRNDSHHCNEREDAAEVVVGSYRLRCHRGLSFLEQASRRPTWNDFPERTADSRELDRST